MVNLPVSQLSISPGTKVRARLLKSIREKGVLTPILVQRNGAGYKILDGRRRVAAAIQAGLEEIPAILLEEGGPEVTLLAHATRSENPLAELEAIRELQRRGLSEKEIARAGYASLARIRRLAKLNRLAPELVEKVEAGEIAPGVAFQIASLPQEEQGQLLEQDEKVTAKTVRQAKYARRQAAVPALPELVEQAKPVTIEELLGCLSVETLAQILAELPDELRFEVWRAKIRRLLRKSDV
jgi:ParB family transcriptional regulator, chromosome partitioning protein